MSNANQLRLIRFVWLIKLVRLIRFIKLFGILFLNIIRPCVKF